MIKITLITDYTLIQILHYSNFVNFLITKKKINLHEFVKKN